jgi:hypothetical protein
VTYPLRTVRHIPLKPSDRLAIERATAVLKAQFPVERVILFG